MSLVFIFNCAMLLTCSVEGPSVSPLHPVCPSAGVHLMQYLSSDWAAVRKREIVWLFAANVALLIPEGF